MKIKNVLLTVALLVGVKTTVVAEVVKCHDSMTVGVEISPDSMLPRPDPVLTQAYLMGVTKYRDIAEFPYFLPEEKWKPMKFYSVIVYGKGLIRDNYSQEKYDGRLLAVCDSGIFLYRPKQQKVRYYPYRVIWVLSKGTTNAHLMWKWIGGGAAAGLVVGPMVSLDPVQGVIPGLFLGGFYGLIGSVYHILGRSLYNRTSPAKRYNVFAKTSNGMAFREKAQKRDAYIRKVDVTKFPPGDMVDFPVSEDTIKSVAMEVVDITAAGVRISDAVVADNNATPGNDGSVSRGDGVVQDNVKNAEDVLEKKVDVKDTSATVAKVDYELIQTAKGYPSNWMYNGFVAGDVRTSVLANQFSWIRQRAVTATDLKKLKSSSEIQFLAMWITTAAGYSFREVVPFNQEQLAFIQPMEPYLAENISAGSMIDPMVLLDLDIENLKVLFETLNKQP